MELDPRVAGLVLFGAYDCSVVLEAQRLCGGDRVWRFDLAHRSFALGVFICSDFLGFDAAFWIFPTFIVAVVVDRSGGALACDGDWIFDRQDQR